MENSDIFQKYKKFHNSSKESALEELKSSGSLPKRFSVLTSRGIVAIPTCPVDIPVLSNQLELSALISISPICLSLMSEVWYSSDTSKNPSESEDKKEGIIIYSVGVMFKKFDMFPIIRDDSRKIELEPRLNDISGLWSWLDEVFKEAPSAN